MSNNGCYISTFPVYLFRSFKVIFAHTTPDNNFQAFFSRTVVIKNKVRALLPIQQVYGQLH